ncbi:MAG: peptidase S41 [Mediterranea sp.]|jgi:C-terminal processing protease CtpA/Prc|nr:peptidase S41 [Mediterranea sp.]
MKTISKKPPILLTLAFVLGGLLFSCGEDRWKEYEPLTAVDTWMYGLMQQEYLWYADLLPEDDKEFNPFQAPAAFLAKIKKKEDSYSFVDTVMETPLPSYGFDYSLVRNPDIDTAYNALITYVIPHSPADNAGLKRGNWIMKVDTSYISKKYEVPLLQGMGATTLQLGSYQQVSIPSEIEGADPEKVWRVVPVGSPIEIGAAAVTEDDPVHYNSVLTLKDGSQIGYLVYNSFTAGTVADPEKYDNELRAWSASMAKQNIDRVILDLRYNRGGTMDCVQLLATLLAPASSLDKTMAMLEYNDKNISKDATLTFDSQLIKDGANLDLKALYLLTGSETAGAPEMMMHALNGKIPLMVTVGSATKGQNVATEQFVNDELHWSVNPVVCNVYNDAGQPFTSFAATVPANTADYTTFLPFGDPQETLLQKTLDYINSIQEQGPTETRTATTPQPFRIEKSVSAPGSRVYGGGRGLRIKAAPAVKP